MLINNTIPFRRKRLGGAPKSAAPTVGPTLVAATFNAEATWVQLQFDEAIDPGGLNPSQITIEDGENSTLWEADGGITIVNANTIRLGLSHPGSSEEPGVHLYATETNGIVSAIDAEPWSGVTDLELPFP